MEKQKGSIISLFYFGAGLVVTGFVVLLMHFLLSQFRTGMVAANVGLDVKYIDAGIQTLTMFDYAFVFIIIGIASASIVSSFLINTHPIFFIFTFLTGIILIVVSAQYTNIWYEFATSEIMATTANEFPIMLRVMQNLPLIMLIISAMISIVLYGKGLLIG